MIKCSDNTRKVEKGVGYYIMSSIAGLLFILGIVVPVIAGFKNPTGEGISFAIVMGIMIIGTGLVIYLPMKYPCCG